MNQNDKPEAERDDDIQDLTDDITPQEDEGTDEQGNDDPLALLSAQIGSLETELSEAKESSLRALADAENTRKRFQREAESHRRYASEPLAKSLLPVADNLYRALDAVSQEDAESDPHLKNMRIGVEMTLKELKEAFEKHGVEEIDPKGQPFDANNHQAMFEQPSDEEPGTVVDVINRGYRLHDRLLRAAMVGVAKAQS